jgi:KAP family P-loop domain
MQIRSSDLEIPSEDPFKNDCLNRRDLEPPLTEFVNQALGPFVLAIDGSWGSGKTTFLKMWQVKLDEAGHLCLYLNAWKNDFVQDPLIAVVGELSSTIENHKRIKDNVGETIKDLEKKAKLIARRLIPIGVRILTHGVVNAEPAIEKLLSDLAGESTQDLVQDYNKGKSDIEEFRTDLESLANTIQTSNNSSAKIVIIIDELDRCRPTYAVQLLERIKHLFDVEGVVFILGIDRTQLSHSIKALYGLKFDATVYLKRFIDMDYRLPEPSIGSYYRYLFEKFEINSRLSQKQSTLKRLELCLGYLICSEKMSLRDQEQTISRLRVVLQTIPASETIFPETLSILLFLYVQHNSVYMSVTKGTMTYKEFITFIEKLPNEKEAFQEFSNTEENHAFSKVLIEGVYLSGLTSLLGAKNNPELQMYVDINTEDQSQEVEDIINLANKPAGFKKTRDRLNLTSNFV